MALRLVEVTIPTEHKKEAVGLLEGYRIESVWEQDSPNGKSQIKLLLEAGETEDISDDLEKKFSHLKHFKLIFYPILAVLPRLKEEAESYTPKKKKKAERVSREELYHSISESANLSKTYIFMIVLSAIVASAGILKNNIAAVIGAMVIAPLLGPNIALALATTLGDMKLFFKAVKTALIGLLVGLGLSIGMGVFLPVDTSLPEIASRMVVGLGDVVLALASGCAGTLAFTSGLPATLVGVMVAVALLPPLVVLGLLAGSGHWTGAWGALLVLLTNVICVNLAAITTFLFQGVRPTLWWETNKARKATKKAILFWIVGLLILILLIFLQNRLQAS